MRLERVEIQSKTNRRPGRAGLKDGTESMSTGQWGPSEVKRERTETAKLFTEKGRSEQTEGYEVALSSWEREKRL